MSQDPNAVLKQALELSCAERAEIADSLLSSLDMPDNSVEDDWAKEADTRIEAFEKGDINARTAESVFSKYQQQ